jgi:hypothetical protein
MAQVRSLANDLAELILKLRRIVVLELSSDVLDAEVLPRERGQKRERS